MPFCVNCGSELRPGAKFCSQCGARVRLPQRQKLTSTKPPKISKSSASLANINEIEAKIQEYETLIAEEDAVNQQIRKLRNDLAEIEKEIRRIVRWRAREELDVKELEGLSWKAIKAMIQGNLQQLKKKEQQEYLAALAKEKEIKQERLNVIRQLDLLQEKRRKIQLAKQELPRLHEVFEQYNLQLSEKVASPSMEKARKTFQEVKMEKALQVQEKEHIENVLQALTVAEQKLTMTIQLVKQAESIYQEKKPVEYVAELFSKEPLVSARKHLLNAQQSLRQASMEMLAVSTINTTNMRFPEIKYHQIVDQMIDEALSEKGFPKTIAELEKTINQIKMLKRKIKSAREMTEQQISIIEEKEQRQKQIFEEEELKISESLASIPSKSTEEPLSEIRPTSISHTNVSDASVQKEHKIPSVEKTTLPKSNENIPNELESLFKELEKISYRFSKLVKNNEGILTNFSTGAIETASWNFSSEGDLIISFAGKNIEKNIEILLKKPPESELPPYDWINPFAGMHITTSEEILYRLKQETQLAENIRKIKKPVIIEIKTKPEVSGKITISRFSLEDVEKTVQLIKDLGWTLELSL